MSESRDNTSRSASGKSASKSAVPQSCSMMRAEIWQGKFRTGKWLADLRFELSSDLTVQVRQYLYRAGKLFCRFDGAFSQVGTYTVEFQETVDPFPLVAPNGAQRLYSQGLLIASRTKLMLVTQDFTTDQNYLVIGQLTRTPATDRIIAQLLLDPDNIANYSAKFIIQ